MPKYVHESRYYTVEEAAKIIGVCYMTVYRWITRGVRLNGMGLSVLQDPISRRYLIAEGSVQKLINRFQPVRGKRPKRQ